jgi:hypothetical protein
LSIKQAQKSFCDRGEEGRGGGSKSTCGSIMRGHRLLLVTITPFSVENASAGKPWRFHSLTSPASERKDTKVKFGDDGISSFCTYTTTNKQNKTKQTKNTPNLHTEFIHELCGVSIRY